MTFTVTHKSDMISDSEWDFELDENYMLVSIYHNGKKVTRELSTT